MLFLKFIVNPLICKLYFFSLLVTEARRHLQKVDKQATYLSHRKVDIEEVSQRLGGQIQDLKSKIAMARHAAESVKISITNQREGTLMTVEVLTDVLNENGPFAHL